MCCWCCKAWTFLVIAWVQERLDISSNEAEKTPPNRLFEGKVPKSPPISRQICQSMTSLVLSRYAIHECWLLTRKHHKNRPEHWSGISLKELTDSCQCLGRVIFATKTGSRALHQRKISNVVESILENRQSKAHLFLGPTEWGEICCHNVRLD